MQYTQVNIGRATNIANGEQTHNSMLSDAMWASFQAVTKHALYRAGAGVVETHSGLGQYQNIWEDSMHLSTLTKKPLDLPSLRLALSAIAQTFGQDCIALMSEGQHELIKPGLPSSL